MNNKPEEKMKVNKWREGINICIDNVLQLFNDGTTLMEKGSYGHACFLFLTAFEETAVAYFIIDRFDTPVPGIFIRALRQGRRKPAERDNTVLPTQPVRGGQSLRLLHHPQLP